MSSSSRRILPKGISLAGTFRSDIPPRLPLPSLPVFCGAVVQDLRLFDGEPTTSVGGSARWLNCDDVADQATIISKLLQATDVSYLKMDLMESMYTESTKSLNAVVLKHNELLLAHTSDIKRLNEKITAKCKEFHEDFKQKCIQLEAENKFLQQREDGLKKAEDELKNRERKIVKEKSELNNRVRELLSSCKQLDNECFPSRKEDEDRKVYSRRKKAQSTGLCSCPDPKDPATQFGYLMGNPRDPYAPKKNLQIGRELYVLHKRTMELDDQVKIQNGSLQIALQVSKEAEGNDLEEKFKNLQSELEEKREPFQELKNSDKDSTLAFNVKDDELQDARLELIDGMKTNHKRACIVVKTLDVRNRNMKCPRHAVQQLWHNKEKEGSECD